MASGDTLALIYPEHCFLPSTSYATYGVRNNGMLVLEFDDDALDERVFASVYVPDGASASPAFTCTVVWMAATATSGNCIWDIKWREIPDDTVDFDAATFAAVQSVTAAAPSVSGEFSYDDITFTNAQADNVSAGEWAQIQISRDSNNASDTMVGDAQLVCVHIKET